MPEAAAPPRFMTHPVEVITEILARVEPGLRPEVIEAAVREAAWKRGQQQRLARALDADPDLLVSGRPQGPPTLERLIRILQAQDARTVVLPRCGSCGEPKHLPQSDGQGRRICGGCFNRVRKAPVECAGCGRHRERKYWDRAGRPRCAGCEPDRGVDHTEVLCQHVLGLDASVDRAELRNLVHRLVPQPFQRREIAWALDAQPDLLTGAGAQGSPRLAALLDGLVDLGVGNVIAPACPFCGRQASLTRTREGLRCCGRCHKDSLASECSRCGRLRTVHTRTLDGLALCGLCTKKDPAFQQECSGCGRVRGVARREGDRVLCDSCGAGHLAICYLCGKEKLCYYADTDQPRCGHCSRRLLHTVTCSACGKDRVIASRTDAGEPLCGGCTRKTGTCIRCQRELLIHARTEEGIFCKTCYRKDPQSFQACSQCGAVERLFGHGLCGRCAVPVVLRDRLAGPDGTMRPELEPVHAALAASEPHNTLLWSSRPGPRQVLAALAATTGPVTHDTLDQLTPAGVAHRLRAVLVNAKVLPERDEHLASLERWINRKLGEVNNLDDRKTLRSFATWHHLRRLRTGKRRVMFDQAAYVHDVLRTSVELLNWLSERDRALATCTQTDIDNWLSVDTYRRTRGFVQWAVSRKHAHDIDIPPSEQQLPRNVFPDHDKRWALARRLLHDHQIDTGDRVAGLLVLLYAQPLSRTSQLTVDQVTQTDKGVQLTIGRKPLELPDPLDQLVLELVDNRKGRAVLGHTNEHPWLFPGGIPGRPLEPATLMDRLQTLDIPARIARNTALMDLAAKMPAGVLSQLLGISAQRATVWSEEAGKTRARYAAEVSRRNHRRAR